MNQIRNGAAALAALLVLSTGCPAVDEDNATPDGTTAATQEQDSSDGHDTTGGAESVCAQRCTTMVECDGDIDRTACIDLCDETATLAQERSCEDEYLALQSCLTPLSCDVNDTPVPLWSDALEPCRAEAAAVTSACFSSCETVCANTAACEGDRDDDCAVECGMLGHIALYGGGTCPEHFDSVMACGESLSCDELACDDNCVCDAEVQLLADCTE